MALQKDKALAIGITCNYHKIQTVELGNNKTTCMVYLYIDAAARAANKSPVETKIHVFHGADNPCTLAAMSAAGANPIALCYTKLKTLPELASALDV